MEKENKYSEINFLKGLLRFTDEPLWYRIVMALILLTFLVVLVVLLKLYVLPFLTAKGLDIVIQKLAAITKMIKGP